MKLVIAIIIVLLVSAYVSVYAMQDPGYIMLSFHDWTIETSFVLFAAAILIGFVLLYAAFRLLIATGLLPRRFRKWNSRHKVDVGRKQLSQAMMKLNLGQWQAAEKLLIKCAKNQELAPMAYLAAARAAQGQGIEARRDGYIQLAQQKTPKDALALTIAQAQIQADFGKPEQAIATLNRLPSHEHKNQAVLALLTRLYTDSKDWPALVRLLAEIKQNKAMPLTNYFETEHLAYSGLINHVAMHKDATALWETWNNIPKDLRAKEDIIADFAGSMIKFGQADAVEEILYNRINKDWSDSLVYIYGLLDGDTEINLSRGRNWLKKHSGNPVLLLTLGRLAMRAHQWETARDYLKQSLEITPNAETYQELGNLLAFLNEQPQALECYRRGLALTSEHSPQPELKSGLVERARLPRPHFNPAEPPPHAQLETAQA